jgi:hypothetical protein
MAQQTGITNVTNKSTMELTGMLGSIIYKDRPVGAVLTDDPRIYIPENVKNRVTLLSENNLLYKKLLHKSCIYHNSISVSTDIYIRGKENIGMILNADPENDLLSVPVINAQDHSIGECIKIIRENVRDIGHVRDIGL